MMPVMKIVGLIIDGLLAASVPLLCGALILHDVRQRINSMKAALCDRKSPLFFPFVQCCVRLTGEAEQVRCPNIIIAQ